jgi:transposase
MRVEFRDQGEPFSYIDPESRIAADHPLRQVRALVRAVLKDLSGSFSRLYSHEGRPSIPPEQLLSALLLRVCYGLRSDRLLMEQLDYNLLFCWFVGLSHDNRVWTPPPSPRTASAFSRVRCSTSSGPSCSNSPRSSRCCRTVRRQGQCYGFSVLRN